MNARWHPDKEYSSETVSEQYDEKMKNDARKIASERWKVSEWKVRIAFEKKPAERPGKQRHEDEVYEESDGGEFHLSKFPANVLYLDGDHYRQDYKEDSSLGEIYQPRNGLAYKLGNDCPNHDCTNQDVW